MTDDRKLNDSELEDVAGGATLQDLDADTGGDGDPSIQSGTLGDCGMIRGEPGSDSEEN